MQRSSSLTKKPSTNRRKMILPAALLFVSVLLMLLPLEGPVASIKAILSYVFIPQIRAAHSTVEYSKDVSNTVRELLETHRENEALKNQLRQIQFESAQAREIFEENKRLTAALQVQTPHKWAGVWAKTAYREPSQWNSVVIDKGTNDGIQVRAAALAQKNGEPVLAGVVIEVNEQTAKVLLLRDEDFSAAVYTSESMDEGLLTGAGAADLYLQYLPLLSSVHKGEAVYTSASSSIFPAGILVGRVSSVERKDDMGSSLTARVEPAAASSAVQELFILTRTAGAHL